jgi:hypothetical protein
MRKKRYTYDYNGKVVYCKSMQIANMPQSHHKAT